MYKKITKKGVKIFELIYKPLIIILLLIICISLLEISEDIYSIRNDIRYDISRSLENISDNSEYQYTWGDSIEFDTSDLEYEIRKISSRLDDVVSELDDVNDYLWDFDINGIRISN